jgi:hypothetical protein
MGEPFVAAMEQFIPELPAVEANTGAPWLWQVRQFQDDCIIVLREIQGLRLQGGRYPTRNEHLSTSACDAGLLVDMVDTWDLGWQVPSCGLQPGAPTPTQTFWTWLSRVCGSRAM